MRRALFIALFLAGCADHASISESEPAVTAAVDVPDGTGTTDARAIADQERFFLDPGHRCAPYFEDDGRPNPNNLSRAEMAAVWGYTYVDFDEITKGLNGISELSACRVAQIQIMDRALAKIPTYVGTVYRGTAARFFPEQPAPYVLKSFTSTSVDRAAATIFVRDAFLAIVVTSGKSIKAYSSEDGSGMTSDEDEILLPRNTSLKLLPASPSGGPARRTETIIVDDPSNGPHPVQALVLELTE